MIAILNWRPIAVFSRLSSVVLVESMNRIRLKGLWPAGKLTTDPFKRRELCENNGASRGCGGRAVHQNRLDAKFSRVRALDFCTCYWKDLQARRIIQQASERVILCVTWSFWEKSLYYLWVVRKCWETRCPWNIRLAYLWWELGRQGQRCVLLFPIFVTSGSEPKIDLTVLIC